MLNRRQASWPFHKGRRPLKVAKVTGKNGSDDADQRRRNGMDASAVGREYATKLCGRLPLQRGRCAYQTSGAYGGDERSSGGKLENFHRAQPSLIFVRLPYLQGAVRLIAAMRSSMVSNATHSSRAALKGCCWRPRYCSLEEGRAKSCAASTGCTTTTPSAACHGC